MRARAAFILLCLSLPGLALGQSLGEAARKEAERREKNRKAGVKAKAYGDQDLQPGGGRPASTGTFSPPGEAASNPPEASAEGSGGGSGEDEADQRREDEARWRERVAEATAKRDRAKAVHEQLNQLWLVDGEQYVDGQGRTVIASLADLRARIARAKVEWDAAEAALEHLHEEARRASVPPGWLR
jgi:hypothetical protein